MLRKSVLIVGGSSDIGKAIAREFAENGYDIFVTYNNGDIEGLKNEIIKKDINFMSYHLDVTNLDEYKKVFLQVRSDASYLDCIVYCAGLSLSEKLLIDESYENIDKLIDINLRGGIYCAKEAMSLFSELKHGSIIFVSSIYGVYGGVCESVYSAAKGGLIALTKSLAQECGNFNVRVNCVAPGFIDTKMTACFNSEEREQISNVTPLNRLGEPEDVAKTVKFLAGDESSFITGEVITISGGVVRY